MITSNKFEPYFSEQRLPPSEDLILDLESEIGMPACRQITVNSYSNTEEQPPSIKNGRTPEILVPSREGPYIGRYFLGFFIQILSRTSGSLIEVRMRIGSQLLESHLYRSWRVKGMTCSASSCPENKKAASGLG